MATTDCEHILPIPTTENVQEGPIDNVNMLILENCTKFGCLKCGNRTPTSAKLHLSFMKNIKLMQLLKSKRVSICEVCASNLAGLKKVGSEKNQEHFRF